MSVFGVGDVCSIWTPKGGPPQYASLCLLRLLFLPSRLIFAFGDGAGCLGCFCSRRAMELMIQKCLALNTALAVAWICFGGVFAADLPDIFSYMNLFWIQDLEFVCVRYN
jgi:hypothetical protein